MHVSRANVRTDRAGRYLTQLCDHGGRMRTIPSHRPPIPDGGEAPPAVRHAEASDTHGVIVFDQGRCTLHATDEALTLTVEAEDPQDLRRIQEGLARRLERVGRRDRLTVTWRRSVTDASPDGQADEPG